MIKITFVERNGLPREVAANAGQTMLQVAQQHQVDIEGACGGAMACATCHLVIHPDWFNRLPTASQDEMDMLDLAPHLTKTSRLGCQITLTEALDGLVVTLPQK